MFYRTLRRSLQKNINGLEAQRGGMRTKDSTYTETRDCWLRATGLVCLSQRRSTSSSLGFSWIYPTPWITNGISMSPNHGQCRLMPCARILNILPTLPDAGRVRFTDTVEKLWPGKAPKISSLRGSRSKDAGNFFTRSIGGTHWFVTPCGLIQTLSTHC